MNGKIVLISDDNDFFEYVVPKLSLRKSDEVFRFGFSELPDKLHLLNSSLLIVNSENNKNQTLTLLELLKDVPVIVFGYNEDEAFVIDAYKKGMFAYFTLNTPDEELEAKLLPALRMITSVEKKSMYREMLVKNNLITKNNEVFLDFIGTMDRELELIHSAHSSATLLAISPDDKSKFLIQPNQIETIILNNVRKNDVLMNYSPSKYFLLLHNADLTKAQKIWENLSAKLPKGLYAGFAFVSNKSRQQLVNETLNKLHEAINSSSTNSNVSGLYSGTNFKFFRQEFNKKLEQVISPVFYHIQQTYNDKLFGMKIEQGQGEGYGVLYIKSKHSTGTLRITSPGLSTINIDVSYERNIKNENNEIETQTDSKRISIEPEELEQGFLQDLIEQFILEFKDSVSNEQINI